MSTEIKTRLRLRKDTLANWEQNDPVLLDGELAIVVTNSDVKIKIGDSVKTFANLDYFKTDLSSYYTKSEIDSKLDEKQDIINVYNTLTPEDVELKDGDFAIVDEAIGSSDKVQKVAYIYNGGTWKALDGNYNAENVYFANDLQYTKQIGELPDVPSTGSGIIAATGKNVKQIFETILAKDNTNPTVTLPTASITISGFPSSATVEPGYETSGTVSWSNLALATVGSYQFGPAVEGVEADIDKSDCYTITYNDGASTSTKYTQSGSFSYDIVCGTANKSISVSTTKVKYTAATNYAKSSLGNDTTKTIAAGQTANATTKSCTWTVKRKMFWGYSTITDVADLDSSIIRALANSDWNGAKTCPVLSEDKSKKSIIIAAPKGTRTVSSVTMPSSSEADVTAKFIKQSTAVSVDGIKDNPTDYDVWIYAPAEMGGTYKIVLA